LSITCATPIIGAAPTRRLPSTIHFSRARHPRPRSAPPGRTDPDL